MGVLIALALLPNRISLINLDAFHIFQHFKPADTCANQGKPLISQIFHRSDNRSEK